MMATCVVGLVGASLLGAAPGDSISDASISRGSPIALAGTDCPLPSCTIDFEPPDCPNDDEICGASFEKGGDCVIDFLPF